MRAVSIFLMGSARKMTLFSFRAHFSFPLTIPLFARIRAGWRALFIVKRLRFVYYFSMKTAEETENIEHLRHSYAHLLAAAIREMYPDALPTIGPAVENGFYYDFKFTNPPSQSDLPAIAQKMREIAPSWKEFVRHEVTAAQAKEEFAGNPFKLELIEDLGKSGEPITVYQSGAFRDLCRGGHTQGLASADLGGFMLSRIAGSYWRGDEKRESLTRIYGFAFQKESELKDYLQMLDEAAKRDHKVLGPQLDLFTFSPLVGSGLPLWTPRGTLLRVLLDDFVWQLRKAKGYERVEIPHITKKELYQTSGHWDKFKDELFRITTREGHEFAMKPMNCPHHTQIYARKKWSYRELPQRYANTTTCYRDEQTGELAGLSRVRAFAQDDAHVFCRMNQAKEEFLKIWDIVHEFYTVFGFNLRVRLSVHDPEHAEKYLGGKDRWEAAEGMLREIVTEKKVDWFMGVGEAAFYGPKLDFMAKDAIGREWQVATIQLDMNMPERFDLSCVGEDGKDERIVMIHAAIMGSIERFLSVLIEHTAGAFPLWLAPEQVRVIPVSEKFTDYAQSVKTHLESEGIRASIADANDTLGKRIREGQVAKVPYLIVVGDKEASANLVAPRHFVRGQEESVALAEFAKKAAREIADKS